MLSFAQTNIQLFNQLRREGYSNNDIDCIYKAYQLAMKLFAAQFRGSGKTFIAHLVGTASILASLRVPINIVAAGLLHAVYQDGDFGDGNADISDSKRAQVRLAVGREVEDYIVRYTALQWDERILLAINNGACEFSQVYRDVLLISLANELEDHLDLGVFYCGNVEERREYINQTGKLMVNMAVALGFPNLATALTEAFFEATTVEIPKALQQQSDRSFAILPNSSPISNSTPQPLVTIVVVPRERFSHTARSLENLYQNTTLPFHLVYVDGNSPPETQSYLETQQRQRGFHLIRTEHFLSPNQARNIGLAQVHTKYVVFIDNDVLVTPNWLEALVECAEETKAGVVSPLYLIGELELQMIHVAGGIAHFEEHLGKRVLCLKHNLEEQLLPNLPYSLQREECEVGEFHCILVRTSVFEKIGLLDEKLMSVTEHIDFCMAVRDRGYNIYFEPSSIITYIPPASLTASDVPYFLLRWCDEWNKISISHFCQKWNLHEDDEVISKHYTWLDRHRQGWLMNYLNLATK